MKVRTMQDLEQLEDRLSRLAEDVPRLVLKWTEGGALDALAMVDERITERGQSATGAAFKDYTPKYKERKKKAGRYRGFVDFTLTGQMLASTTTGFENIAPTEKTVTGATALVRFDGRDELTKKKLEGNNKHRPGFLNPSKAEMERVVRIANENMRMSILAYFE